MIGPTVSMRRERRRRAGWKFAAILLWALLLRLWNFNAPLEYDEIWSMENFAPLDVTRILISIASPNNHPINTLWIKFILRCGAPVTAIRWASLLAGVALIPLGGFVGRVLAGGRRSVALWCMWFLACSAPAVAYSRLARGYELQLFFLFCFSAGLAACGRWRPKRKFLRFLPETAVFLGGVGAILTLPTSVIYLGTITLTAGWIRRRAERSTLAVLGAGMLFTFCWLFLQYDALQMARGWGMPIDSPAVFREHCATELWPLFSGFSLAAALCGALLSPRRLGAALLIGLLPIGAAVLTNGGPMRSYLPLNAMIDLFAGCGIALLLARIPAARRNFFTAVAAAAAVFFFAAAYPRWRTTDWRSVFRITSSLPETTFAVYTATDSFPAAWNNRPRSYEDWGRRLLCNAENRELVVFDRNGVLNGCDRNGCERRLSLPFNGVPIRIDTLDGFGYRLRELKTAPEPGETVLIAVRPLPEELFRMIFSLFFPQGKEGKCLMLNSCFTAPLLRPDGVYRFQLWAGTFDDLAPDTVDILCNKIRGAVSIYRIAPL